MAIALVFYTKATETKECISYVVTKTLVGIDKMKEACEELNGVMASEDLKDSENAEKAKLVIDKFREEDPGSQLFFGITARDIKQKPDKARNPFVFSDGTRFNDDGFLYEWVNKWTPYYIDLRGCVYLEYGNLNDEECDKEGKAFCSIKSACAESGSKSSRANFPLFAAGSVLSAFLSALLF